MWRKEIEIILARQLSSYLATPIFLADSDGNLVFYNESAAAIVGHSFDEMVDLRATELPRVLEATDDSGEALSGDGLPLLVALAQREPSHRRFWIRAMNGERRLVESTAIPLIGIGGRFLGAISVSWEVSE